MPKIQKTNRKATEYLIFPLLILICIAAYLVTVRYRPYEITAQVLENDGATYDVTESHPPLITETKCARLSGNKIGIYDCYGNLEYTVDTDVTFLPRADRIALADGIVFDSESSLWEFIESLDS